MRWIKLSERKPENERSVILRKISSKRLIANLWNFNDRAIELESVRHTGTKEKGDIPFEEVEWLDESIEDQHGNIDKAVIIEKLITELKKLTDEERYGIICSFCKHCGSTDTNCYCHRDD